MTLRKANVKLVKKQTDATRFPALYRAVKPTVHSLDAVVHSYHVLEILDNRKLFLHIFKD